MERIEESAAYVKHIDFFRVYDIIKSCSFHGIWGILPACYSFFREGEVVNNILTRAALFFAAAIAFFATNAMAWNDGDVLEADGSSAAPLSCREVDSALAIGVAAVTFSEEGFLRIIRAAVHTESCSDDSGTNTVYTLLRRIAHFGDERQGGWVWEVALTDGDRRMGHGFVPVWEAREGQAPTEKRTPEGSIPPAQKPV